MRKRHAQKLPLDKITLCKYTIAMRVYYPISQINNDVLRRLIDKNKKKPPRELHLIVYQMCYTRACRYKTLSAEDVACEVYIKIMKIILKTKIDDPKAYILTVIDHYCQDKEKQRKYRQGMNNKISHDVHRFLMYQIQYGLFEDFEDEDDLEDEEVADDCED